MKRKKWLLGVVILAVLAVVGQWPDGKLRLSACEVGQGDAILVIKKFNQVLVDGGPPNGKVLTCLGEKLPFWDRKLEMVVMTHPDLDHIGGLMEVIKRYRVEMLLVPDVDGTSEQFEELVAEVKRRAIKVRLARQGLKMKLGEMTWQVYWPETADGTSVWVAKSAEGGEPVEAKEEDINAWSVVLRVNEGDRSALLTGDLPIEVEERVAEVGGWPVAEVLKVGHHGSKTSTSQKFLGLVAPEWALISVGESNRYGHPAAEVLARLEGAGVKILRTDEMGTVTLVGEKNGWRE